MTTTLATNRQELKNNTIRKVGNIAALLDRLHKSFKKNVEFQSPGYRKNAGIQELDDSLLEFLREYSPEYQLRRASYFDKHLKKGCDAWHIDNLSPHDGLLIAAWENPTQILVKNRIRRDVWENCSRGHLRKEELAAKSEIVTPNPGDVYLLGANVVHRTSPKAIGGRHLVGRIWLRKNV